MSDDEDFTARKRRTNKGLSQYADDDEDEEGENQYSTQQELQKDDKTNMYAFEIRKNAEQHVKYLLATLGLSLLCCLWTLRDSFTCSGGTDQDCEDIRKNLSCKSRVVSPMWGQMGLKIGTEGNTSQVDVSVFCGWETASSQIRICIVLSAIYTTFLAYRAVINESKSLADRYLHASQLLTFLLCTTGLFDFLSIYDSQTDNFALCDDNMPYDYPIHSTMKSYEIKCYTGLFSLTGLMMVLSSLGVYLISLVMKRYRNYISIDNL